MTQTTFAHKTGNGAFEVHVIQPCRVAVKIGAGDDPKIFNSARQAYDWCVSGYADLQGTMRGYSYLNAAYALEDMIGEAA